MSDLCAARSLRLGSRVSDPSCAGSHANRIACAVHPDPPVENTSRCVAPPRAWSPSPPERTPVSPHRDACPELRSAATVHDGLLYSLPPCIMEVIRFDGYTVAEKVAIARGYLWPRQIERKIGRASCRERV